MKNNSGRKMMVASAVRKNREHGYWPEKEMRGRNYDYHYAPEGAVPEMRRQRDSRGRYMTQEWDEPMDRQPMIGYDRGDDYTRGLMPMEYDRRMPNRMASTYSGYDGDIYARGSIIMSPNREGAKGGIRGMGSEAEAPVDEYTATRWIKSMKTADGTDPMHFKLEQTEQMRSQIAPDCKPYEFWVAMNMVYADYGAVAKKVGVDKHDYYAHMAKAFLCDPDAGENKLRKYMDSIAK